MMTSKDIIGGVAGVALIGALLLAAFHNNRLLEQSLPPRLECSTQAEALQESLAYVTAHGGSMIPVLGTGSMAPYIPPAPAGANPRTTVVAFLVTAPAGRLDDVRVGTLCLYRAAWKGEHVITHQAAARDGEGWIMSGLHNEHSEAQWRMTAANFVAIVARVFVWPNNGESS